MLPISLLVDGKRCVVIGGGKVAARKVRSLVDAGANVIVISPEVRPDIEKLTEDNNVTLIKRLFAEDDLSHAFMVFAAANDAELNQEVLKLCRRKNVLCAAADLAWQDGDFISPASFTRNGLTVSVSTGGQSCRRSRLIKQDLARHIDMVDSTDLLVLGTDHNYLSLEKREPFHLTNQRLQQVGEMVMHVQGIHEFILLNTCNRSELVAIIARKHGVENILKRALGLDQLRSDAFYVKWGTDAFSHMAVVLAGLLSQVPGENHIVAQVKEALEKCQGFGWAAGMMQDWIGNALHVSKEIRQRTEHFSNNFEIEDVGLHYLKAEYSDIADKSIMVIGAGTVGRGLIQRLMEEKIQTTLCYHKTRPHGLESLTTLVKLFTFDELPKHLPATDVVICATSSSEYVLHKAYSSIFKQSRDILIMDLSTPRNVDPELEDLVPNAKIVDLDDLKQWYRQEPADMTRILDLSEQVVNQHMDLYERIIESFQGKPRSRVPSS